MAGGQISDVVGELVVQKSGAIFAIHTHHSKKRQQAAGKSRHNKTPVQDKRGHCNSTVGITEFVLDFYACQRNMTILLTDEVVSNVSSIGEEATGC